ncbi:MULTISPECIES: hypothetical protein [unclassified Psychrobacter]|uniref:TRAFAC clade GTPase domain-containing protein n=1 Tax=unclassified Psychrobacter TaxID=196806 RepID=UPI0018834137|nr:hypothetical protein [Psychrobacter sp. NG25]MBF0659529.1 hypothetical protein [Psychrobacter sp. NG25]
MKNDNDSILIIGESGVGKTHYGAKVFMSLLESSNGLSMEGMPANVEPFSETIGSLNDGLSASHTPANVYVESIWPIIDSFGFRKNLVWPDYGGEQILNMVTSRKIPDQWCKRVTESSSWIFMIRPSQYRLSEDILSKPSGTEPEHANSSEDNPEVADQPRLIELLQILLYLHKSATSYTGQSPKVCFLISCWDELETEATPADLLYDRLPMLSEFIHSHWINPLILGLSALGKALEKAQKDHEYSRTGPEQNGYVVKSDGTISSDVTLPIQYLFA